MGYAFVVTALHFIDVCKQLTSIQLAEVLDDQKFNQTTLQSIGSAVSDVTLDYSAPLTFLDKVQPGKDFIYQALIEHAATTLHTSKTALFELKSAFWTLAQEVYQEWYLGYKLFAEVEQKLIVRTTSKGIFIMKSFYALSIRLKHY